MQGEPHHELKTVDEAQLGRAARVLLADLIREHHVVGDDEQIAHEEEKVQREFDLRARGEQARGRASTSKGTASRGMSCKPR